jgi:hypothetical protein
MNQTEKILSRIAQGFINSSELFSKHPLLAWRLVINSAQERKLFLEIISGGNVCVHTTDDGWRDLRNCIARKINHHFTKFNQH